MTVTASLARAAPFPFGVTRESLGVRVVLDHSCQVQRHPLAERGDDLYETPPVAVEALLRVEKIPHRVWEPACGPGNIVKTLRAAGHDVLATDLVDYGDPTASYRHDFLMERKPPPGCEAIVTNPPFKLVEQFVAHAIEICPLVIMLLRLAFYESDRRSDILEGCGLARIHCFRKRLPMMHRAGWEGRKANSGMAFGWFIWDRAHSGSTTIDRISWEAERNGSARRTRQGGAESRAESGDMWDIPPFLRRAP
jgi:hypothetical protein